VEELAHWGIRSPECGGEREARRCRCYGHTAVFAADRLGRPITRRRCGAFFCFLLPAAKTGKKSGPRRRDFLSPVFAGGCSRRIPLAPPQIRETTRVVTGSGPVSVFVARRCGRPHHDIGRKNGTRSFLGDLSRNVLIDCYLRVVGCDPGGATKPHGRGRKHSSRIVGRATVDLSSEVGGSLSRGRGEESEGTEPTIRYVVRGTIIPILKKAPGPAGFRGPQSSPGIDARLAPSRFGGWRDPPLPRSAGRIVAGCC